MSDDVLRGLLKRRHDLEIAHRDAVLALGDLRREIYSVNQEIYDQYE